MLACHFLIAPIFLLEVVLSKLTVYIAVLSSLLICDKQVANLWVFSGWKL